MAKTKLKFKPTPISRLFKYQKPIKMVGDPNWSGGRDAWANRERVVYAHMMDQKSWPMPWLPETWHRAQEDNETLDYHLRAKWRDYEDAIMDHWFYQHDEAERDNAAWDYHHENFIAA
jgi:hypothetical protein